MKEIFGNEKLLDLESFKSKFINSLVDQNCFGRKIQNWESRLFFQRHISGVKTDKDLNVCLSNAQKICHNMNPIDYYTVIFPFKFKKKI